MISISVACKDAAQVGDLVHLLQRLVSYYNGILSHHVTDPHDLGLVPADLQAHFGCLLLQAWCHGRHVLPDVGQQSDVIHEVEVLQVC